MDEKRTGEVMRILRDVAKHNLALLPHYREAIEDAAGALERLRAALDGIRAFVAEDFPEREGEIDWSAYPVSFGYAKAYRALLVALGRIPA